jgi:hypothetical protein
MRYTIYSDDDGHRFIVPVDRLEEFEKAWEDGFLSNYALRWEGQNLYFSHPVLED